MPNPELKELMHFSDGMHGSPGFYENALRMPAKMTNLLIDHNGRIEARRFTQSVDPDDVSLTRLGSDAKQLAVLHYIGTTNRKLILGIPDDIDWVNTGRRVFFAGDTHKWSDLKNDVDFDWTLPKPEDEPVVEFDVEDLADNDDIPNVSDMAVFPYPYWYDRSSIWYAVIRTTRLRIVVFDNDPGGEDDARGAIVGTQSVGQANHSLNNYEIHEPGIYRRTWAREDMHGDEDDFFIRMDVKISGGDYIEQYRRTDLILVRPPNPESSNQGEISITDDITDLASEIYISEDEGDPVDYGEVRPADRSDNTGYAVGFRAGWYSIAYTFASSAYGMETAPSKVAKFFLPGFPSGLTTLEKTRRNEIVQHARVDLPIKITVPTGGDNFGALPAWANQIKFYAHRGRFAEESIEARELPFSFTHIGSNTRAELTDTLSREFIWQREVFHIPRQTMYTKEFKTDPPVTNLEHIDVHAGRMWGYDRLENAVRFSLIDGNGISQYDVFPYKDTALPHGITLIGSWQARQHQITPIPGGGGIYVFFKDAIRTIVGKSILTGVFSSDVPPYTDVDASGGITGIGSYSRRSIVEYDDYVLFLSSDKRVRAISGTTTLSIENVGRPIQRYLDAATARDLREAFALRFNRFFYLSVGDVFYVYDTEYTYWTTFEYPMSITDAVWSQGGASDESILYALAGTTVHELDALPTDSATKWEIISNWQNVPKDTIVHNIYCFHDSTPKEISVRLDVDGVTGEATLFTPNPGNAFRESQSTGPIQVRFRVVISGTGTALNMLDVMYD